MKAGAKSLEGLVKEGEGRKHAELSPDKKCFYSDDPNCVTELGTIAWDIWGQQILANIKLVGNELYNLGSFLYKKSNFYGKVAKDWYNVKTGYHDDTDEPETNY